MSPYFEESRQDERRHLDSRYPHSQHDDARLAAADLAPEADAPVVVTTELGERLLRARLAEMRMRGAVVRTPRFDTTEVEL